MTTNGKLLASVALAPIVADFLEDAELKGTAKMKANLLISQIRAFDNFILGNADKDAIEQQIDIQRAFRQWVEFNFTEDESSDDNS
tara:strand:+ start:3418 stop:3675 length:258 start_codon:yes stop_codon:yes gene_type:complete